MAEGSLNLSGEMVSLMMTFKISKKLVPDIQNWLFDYFTNLHIQAISKDSADNFSIEATIKDQLISVPKMMMDNLKVSEYTQKLQSELIKTSEYTKSLQSELLTASDAIQLYSQINDKSKMEIQELKKKVIDQTYLIENLAKENLQYLQERESFEKLGTIDLCSSIKKERDDLFDQAKEIADLMKSLCDENEAAKESLSDIDFQPPV